MRIWYQYSRQREDGKLPEGRCARPRTDEIGCREGQRHLLGVQVREEVVAARQRRFQARRLRLHHLGVQLTADMNHLNHGQQLGQGGDKGIVDRTGAAAATKDEESQAVTLEMEMPPRHLAHRFRLASRLAQRIETCHAQ